MRRLGEEGVAATGRDEARPDRHAVADGAGDERADAYVALWTRGRWVQPLRVTVALVSVPAVVRAFARAGFLAKGTNAPGVLAVERATVALPGAPAANEAARREGLAVLRRVWSMGISNEGLLAAGHASAGEIALLRRQRFEEMGLDAIRRVAGTLAP